MEPPLLYVPLPPTSERTSPTASLKVFIYGTVCAMPLLAWILTGDGRNAENIEMVKSMCRPARVQGFIRRSVNGSDHPAVIRAVEDNLDEVDGFVITLRNASQRRKLDDFEGETYRPIRVTAEVKSIDGHRYESEEVVDMYIWDGDMAVVSPDPWCLDKFIQQRLEDWLVLFEGIKMTGEE